MTIYFRRGLRMRQKPSKARSVQCGIIRQGDRERVADSDVIVSVWVEAGLLRAQLDLARRQAQGLLLEKNHKPRLITLYHLARINTIPVFSTCAHTRVSHIPMAMPIGPKLRQLYFGIG